MELVHSVSIYDPKTKRDIVCNKLHMKLKGSTDGDIANFLHNGDIDWDFIFDIARLIRDKGIEATKEYAYKKYPQHKEGEVVQ